MARKKAKPKRLRLRSTAGLLEDIEISLPVAWAATLRAQSVKLGLSLDALLVQYAGHLVHEFESLEAAVAAPTLGDDAARFRLRGSFMATFEREALRSGVPVRSLVHRVISDAADVFDGREKQPAPQPLVLIPGKRLGGSSS